MLSNNKFTCEAYTYTYLETAEQVFLSLRSRPVVLEHVQGRLGRFSALARSWQELDLEPSSKGQKTYTTQNLNANFNSVHFTGS